jgi:hypothetical protein
LYLTHVEDTEDARVGAIVAVRGDFGVFYVTQTMAERIERALDRCDVKPGASAASSVQPTSRAA